MYDQQLPDYTEKCGLDTKGMLSFSGLSVKSLEGQRGCRKIRGAYWVIRLSLPS